MCEVLQGGKGRKIIELKHDLENKQNMIAVSLRRDFGLLNCVKTETMETFEDKLSLFCILLCSQAYGVQRMECYGFDDSDPHRTGEMT